MSFSEKLRSLRLEHKLSQDELGKIIGVHGRHISKYEHGKVLPGADVLVKISKYFNISIDYLLFDDPENSNLENIINDELKRKLAILEKMSNENKEVVIKLLDAFIAQNK